MINLNNWTDDTQTSSKSNVNILNLQKNDILDLTKKNPGVKKVNFCAGWDIATSGADFDLDIGAYLLNANGKITGGQDVIFYNHMECPGVKLLGDNRTGAGDGDDEIISLDLSKISSTVTRIVFAITIFDADAKQQTFGMVNNSYVRLLDVANEKQELCIYPLKEQFSTETAVIAAELIRENGEWQFHTIGEGKHADLNGLLALYR